jgi:hypothetical protein
MAKTKTVRLQVERVRTETVMVDVPIDVAEFEEWALNDGGGDAWTKERVCEYLEADADWPENLEPIVDGLAWTPSSVIDDEYTMQVPDDLPA